MNSLRQKAIQEIEYNKLRMGVEVERRCIEKSKIYRILTQIRSYTMSAEKKLTNPRAIALQEVKEAEQKESVKRYKELFERKAQTEKVLANINREIEELDIELSND